MIKRLRTNEKGLSLLEVLVAVFILAIVAGPLLNLFVTNSRLIHVAYEKTDATYRMKSLMEGLFNPANYPSDAKKLDTASGKYIRWQFTPSGSTDAASGTTRYAHLIIQDDGSGFFTGFDGSRITGLSTYSSITLSADTAIGSYSFSDGNGHAHSASAPELKGSNAVLLVISQSTTKAINVNTAARVIAYTPPDLPEASVTASRLTLYNIDVPAATALLNAKLLVYKDSSAGAAPESVFENTLSVSTRP